MPFRIARSAAAGLTLSIVAYAGGLTGITIPPVKVALKIENQPVNVSVSGTLAPLGKADGGERFRLRLATDLSGLQAHLTPLLSAALNRADRCGDRIELHDAVMTPGEPRAMLTARLHYERWGCMKAFGKQITKRLVGGNGVVVIELAPGVENNTLHVNSRVKSIEADGSLGDLLRSGTLGDSLREKVERTIVNAVEKSTRAIPSLPPSFENMVALRDVRFADGGGGRLQVVAEGELTVPEAQVQALLHLAGGAVGR